MIDAVAVVGPTGSGKTDVAIELAEGLGTEIVSADSMQFYRGMAIGTGQPTVHQLARVPHHFIAHLEPSERMSAGEYQVAAREVVARINAEGHPAVIVGGSGLYVQALVEGLFEGPGADAEVRGQLQDRAEAEGIDVLYAELQACDPDYAATIDPADLRRIVRALEVYAISGQPFSALHRDAAPSEQPLNAPQFALDWPRDVLYDRINRRVDAMMEAGLLDEVNELLDNGHGPDIARLKAIGYRELVAYLRGDTTLDEAVELTKMYSRRYAKRQLTWWRADPGITWLPAEGRSASELADEIVRQLPSEG